MTFYVGQYYDGVGGGDGASESWWDVGREQQVRVQCPLLQQGRHDD